MCLTGHRLPSFCVQEEGLVFPAHPYVENFWEMISYPNTVVNLRIKLRHQVVSAIFLSSLEIYSFLIIFFSLQHFVLKLIKTMQHKTSGPDFFTMYLLCELWDCKQNQMSHLVSPLWAMGLHTIRIQNWNTSINSVLVF